MFNIKKGQEVYIHKSGPMTEKHNLEKYVVTDLFLEEKADGRYIAVRPVDNVESPILKFTRKVTLWGKTYPRYVEEEIGSRKITYRMIPSRDDYLQEILDSSKYSNYLSLVKSNMNLLSYNELLELEEIIENMMIENKRNE